MMTARYPFLDCVPAAVRDRPRYAGDHVIRHYRPLGLAALLRDLDADPSTPELEIIGGIGRLVLRADGSETWEPTIPGTPRAPHPPPRPADPALASARRAICQSCTSMADRCTAAGCGCAGEGKPDVWSSRCPLGKWPSIDCNP
jgi:hypothetical protein